MVVGENNFSGTAQDDRRLVLAVDPEHSGIRMAGCSSFVVSLGVVFFALSLIWPEGSIFSFMIALVVASLFTYGLDHFLKGRWKSGRELIADTDSIRIEKRGHVENKVDPQQQVNVMPWRFEVPRSGRVKKGWYVVAMALEQDGVYIPVYTFVDPKTFDTLPVAEHFTRLMRRKDMDTDASSERGMRLAGQQRRLHEAERQRQLGGAELARDDFIALIEFLQRRYNKWMIR